MDGSRCFVISTGRTGSTFLARWLGKHPELDVPQRDLPKFRVEALRYLRWKFKSFRATRLRHHLPLGLYYRCKFLVSRTALGYHGRRRYVELNNYLFPFVSEISAFFPSARIIHLIRDPRTFFPSALNRGWCLKSSRRRMEAPDIGEMTVEEWRSLTRLQQLCWYWLRTNTMILAAAPKRTIRYESIFHSNHSGFGDLLEEIGLSRDYQQQIDFNQKVNQTRVYYFPEWKNWDPAWQLEARSYFEQAEREFQVTRFYPDLLDGG